MEGDGFFDGDFTNADAAAVGGMMGFAEESMREEERGLEDPETAALSREVKEDSFSDERLKVFSRSYPKLFEHIVKIASEQTKRWREDREAREEVRDELEAIEACEEMMPDEG